MSNLNMPVKYCKDENDEEFSPVVYQESMFNDDGTRMEPVPRKMFAKAYDPTKTYPTESLFCINDNKFYKFTGSGTTTGTFDSTKWTETDDATELTALNSTLAGIFITKNYNYTYSCPANSEINVSANDLNKTTPSGYTPISFYNLSTGTASAIVRNIYLDQTGTGIVLKIKNLTGTALSSISGQLSVVYAKSSCFAP